MKNIPLTFLLLFVLFGCKTPNYDYEKPVLGGHTRPPQKVDFQIIPIEGFPYDFATRLESDLEEELELKVAVSVHMGTSPSMYSDAQRQHVASEIAKEARKALEGFTYQEKPPYTIVLTHLDINERPFNLRFLFAQHFNDVSVVSVARMDPRGYGGKYDAELVYSRMKKLVKKGLGLRYFGYTLSTDKKSVMYSPIMGLQDLDEVGTEY